MHNPIKTLPHVIEYVKTHKFFNKLAQKMYYRDVPEYIPLIGADFYLILHLDDYYEYAGSFHNLDDAKTKGQAYLGMYTGFQVYSSPETKHTLMYQHFEKRAFQPVAPYIFLPKEP